MLRLAVLLVLLAGTIAAATLAEADRSSRRDLACGERGGLPVRLGGEAWACRDATGALFRP